MLALYYTISSGVGKPQSDTANSIGGYRAGNTIPNDEFGNIFDAITPMTIKKKKPEYRAIVLKNEGASTLEDVTLWFGDQPTQGIFSLAAIAMNQDANGNFFMERTPNGYSKPLYATFSTPTATDKADIGNIPAGGEIGVWLKREVNVSAALEEESKVYEPDLENQYWFKPIVPPEEEQLNFNISFK